MCQLELAGFMNAAPGLLFWHFNILHINAHKYKL